MVGKDKTYALALMSSIDRTAREPMMIGAYVMHAKQPGPCVVCGDRDYDLSCGGPTICPKCDCGNFDAVTVEKQVKVIADLRRNLASRDDFIVKKGLWPEFTDGLPHS